MKFLARVTAASTVVLYFFLGGCAQTPDDTSSIPDQRPVVGEITLTAVSGLQQSNILTKSFLTNFTQQVNSRGKGIAQINYLGGPNVVSPRAAALALKRGQFDLLHSPVNYYLGTVPEGSAMLAANQPPNRLRENGGWEILQEVFAKKAGSRLIAWGEFSTQFQIYFSKQPKLDANGIPNLSGFRMRATGIYRSLFKSLGASTINIRSYEISEAMKRGTIDGFAFFNISMVPLGLHKLVKYRLVPAFYHTNIVVTMNLDRWKTLPRKTQRFIDEMAIEYERTSFDYIEDVRKREENALHSAGVKDIILTGTAAKKFLSIAHGAHWQRVKRRSNYANSLRSKLYLE